MSERAKRERKTVAVYDPEAEASKPQFATGHSPRSSTSPKADSPKRNAAAMLSAAKAAGKDPNCEACQGAHRAHTCAARSPKSREKTSPRPAAPAKAAAPVAAAAAVKPAPRKASPAPQPVPQPAAAAAFSNMSDSAAAQRLLKPPPQRPYVSPWVQEKPAAAPTNARPQSAASAGRYESKGSRQCKSCGGWGHFQKTCPQRFAAGANVPQPKPRKEPRQRAEYVSPWMQEKPPPGPAGALAEGWSGGPPAFHARDRFPGEGRSKAPSREVPYSGSEKGRYEKLQELGVVAGEWMPEEDAALTALVRSEGAGDWTNKSAILGKTCGFRSSTAIRKRWNRLSGLEWSAKHPGESLPPGLQIEDDDDDDDEPASAGGAGSGKRKREDAELDEESRPRVCRGCVPRSKSKHTCGKQYSEASAAMRYGGHGADYAERGYGNNAKPAKPVAPPAGPAGIKGVNFDKSTNKWLVRHLEGGKQKYYGRFATQEEAEKAAYELKYAGRNDNGAFASASTSESTRPARGNGPPELSPNATYQYQPPQQPMPAMMPPAGPTYSGRLPGTLKGECDICLQAGGDETYRNGCDCREHFTGVAGYHHLECLLRSAEEDPLLLHDCSRCEKRWVGDLAIELARYKCAQLRSQGKTPENDVAVVAGTVDLIATLCIAAVQKNSVENYNEALQLGYDTVDFLRHRAFALGPSRFYTRQKGSKLWATPAGIRSTELVNVYACVGKLLSDTGDHRAAVPMLQEAVTGLTYLEGEAAEITQALSALLEVSTEQAKEPPTALAWPEKKSPEQIRAERTRDSCPACQAPNSEAISGRAPKHTCEMRKERRLAKNTPWEDLGPKNSEERDPNCEACMGTGVKGQPHTCNSNDQCEKNFFCAHSGESRTRGYHHRGNGGQCNGQKELNAFVASGGDIATLGINQSDVKVHNQRGNWPAPSQ